MSVAARRLAYSTGFFLLLGLAILAIALLLGGGSQAVVALEDPCPTFAVEFDCNEFPTCARHNQRLYALVSPVPEEGTIVWTIEGESRGLHIDLQTGVIRRADPTRALTTGRVTIRASLAEDPDCYAKADLRIEDCGSCASGDCGAGKGAIDLNGIDARFKMGKATDGESAGLIWLHAALPGATLATPAALTFNVHRDDVSVILDQQDALRQILAPQALADIVVEDDYSYRIDFYAPADVGQLVNGLYETSGDPFVTWLIENPDGASATNRLTITRSVDTVVQTVHAYVYNAGTTTWTLTTGDGSSTLRKEVEQWVDDERRYSVYDGADEDVHRVHERFTSYAFGSVRTEQTLDPNGAELVTTWEYYTSGTGKTGKLRSVTRPDGSWSFYDYDSEG
ncbi:MAG: hypothetical protein HUU22_00300, partial [Phycisphaerae bacterium]|nr:hypothetical protein [Phycisphaerae bacterium]